MPIKIEEAESGKWLGFVREKTHGEHGLFERVFMKLVKIIGDL